ncbi:hypothetical protein HH299_12990, partial [Xanthomonas sp. Kuri4-2]
MYAPLDLYDTAAARLIDAQATALLGGDPYRLMQRAGEAAWQVPAQVEHALALHLLLSHWRFHAGRR